MIRFKIGDDDFDPGREIVICEHLTKNHFYFANKNQKNTPLCSHEFKTPIEISEWICVGASKTDPSLCPACVKEKGLVILTAPHSNCSQEVEDHECDSSSMKMALLLRDAFQKRGIATRLFPSPEKGEVASWRPLYDENRPQFQDSDMRTKIKEFFFNYKDKISLAIDVHSFPNDYQIDAPFYILDNNPLTEQEAQFSKLTRDYGKSVGVPVMEGNRSMNYIQTFFRSNGTPSFLLEVNESLSGRDMKKYAPLFVDSIGENFLVGVTE